MSEGVTVELDDLISLRWVAQRLRFAARRSARSTGIGGHASRWRGRGIDFDEVRDYQPGDDIRVMDWRVTARTGRAHTRLFHEERERPVLIAVDLGAHMRFGTRVAFKSVIAARIAAFWAWYAARQGDRVGGVVFADDWFKALPPHAGSSGVLRLLRALAEAPTDTVNGAAGGLRGAFDQLKWVAHPGSTLVIVSDFRDWDAALERPLRDLSKLGDVVAVHVYDALEAKAPPPGRYRVSNGRDALVFDSGDDALRDAWRKDFKQRATALRHTFHGLGVHLLRVATHDDLARVLGGELRAAYARVR